MTRKCVMLYDSMISTEEHYEIFMDMLDCFMVVLWPLIRVSHCKMV